MPRTQADRLIIEIIRRADREMTGKTRLFKAFYFAHLLYYEQNPDILTDWPIARMPQGPGIHNSDQLFAGLTRDGYLTIEHIHNGPYPEFRYRLTDKADAVPSLPEDAARAVERAVDLVKGRTAADLSHFTHEYSRSWIEGKTGDILNIYVDLIPEDEYERRKGELDALADRLKDVFES